MLHLIHVSSDQFLHMVSSSPPSQLAFLRTLHLIHLIHLHAQERGCHLPEQLTSAKLGVQKAEKSHKPKPKGDRLSTEKTIDLNNAAYTALERVEADHLQTSKRSGGQMQGLLTFFAEVRALCTCLAKYAEYKLQNNASSEMNRNRTAPSHTPTNPDDLDYFEVEVKRCSIRNPCLEPLNQRMAAAELYEPVLIDDAIMGVTVEPSMYGNGEIARKEQRRKFIRELRDCGGPCQMRVHIFHPGGPHGSIRFAWRLPVGEVDRDDTAEAAAVATATAAAPLTASREMRRSFFDRFSPTGASPAVLKNMYQHLTGDSAAPENLSDKVGSS